MKLAAQVREYLQEYGPCTQLDIVEALKSVQPSISRVLANDLPDEVTSVSLPAKLWSMKSGKTRTVKGLLAMSLLRIARIYNAYDNQVQTKGRAVANAYILDKLDQEITRCQTLLQEVRERESEQ